MRPTSTEQYLADQCARESKIYFCANYVGRLTNELYKNVPVFSPSFDNSLPLCTGLPVVIIVNNNEALWFNAPLSLEYLQEMEEETDYSIGETIFHKYEDIIKCPDMVSKREYEYIKPIVDVCSEHSYNCSIDKQTVFQFLEMAERFHLQIQVLPIEETMNRCDGWEYYLKLVKRETNRWNDSSTISIIHHATKEERDESEKEMAEQILKLFQNDESKD